MHPSYFSKFQALESKLENFMADMSNLPEAILLKKPSPNVWSPIEVIQHLILVEKGSLAYVKKKSSYPEKLMETGPFDFYRKIKLFVFMHLPIKVKAPTIVNESNFRQDASLKDLATAWKADRKDLEQFLENYPENFRSKLTYKHPFAGRLTLDGMLTFIDGHFDRHRLQIEKIIAG